MIYTSFPLCTLIFKPSLAEWLNFANLFCAGAEKGLPLYRPKTLFRIKRARPRRTIIRACDQMNRLQYTQTLIAAVKNDGFTLDTVLWSMLGAITTVWGGLGTPRMKSTCRNDMIMRIKRSHRPFR
jgi:hypothetical protein